MTREKNRSLAGGLMSCLKGSNEWRVVEMNSRGIPKLLTDLKNLDKTGFAETQCIIIKSALNKIINSANGLDSGRLFRDLVLAYEDFLQTYTEWNNNGTDGSIEATSNRRARINELIEIQRRVTRVISKRRKFGTFNVLAADAGVADAAYAQFRIIVDSSPTIFKGLSHSVANYESAT
jgi:hypothetical protein